jgi:hypothetical protein
MSTKSIPDDWKPTPEQLAHTPTNVLHYIEALESEHQQLFTVADSLVGFFLLKDANKTKSVLRKLDKFTVKTLGDTLFDRLNGDYKFLEVKHE